MELSSQVRMLLAWLGATAAAVLATAVQSWLGVGPTTAGMVFLALVVWIATQSGLAVSLYCAAVCAVSFDFFFLPPVHTLTLAGPQEWVAIFTFLASSVVAGRVAERARRQTRQAEQRREDVERLNLLGQEMMLYEDAAGLMSELPRILQRVFSLDAVALYVRDPEQFFTSSNDLPMSLQASMSAMGHGQAAIEMLPGEIAALPLMVGMRNVGVLGWRPATLSREVAAAVSAQAGIALARVLAMEASARAEAQREGERLRTALIDSLTHELRTPLTSIRAAATTLVEGGDGLDEAARLDMAVIVAEESARLDALIGEAVEMAEIDANVVQVNAVPLLTRALLENAVNKSQAALAKHQVVLAVEEPDTPAMLDPQLLSRVLRHLLENAARYTPPGSRIVLRSRRAGGRLEFEVEDNGPGIDQADLPLIFEKFYRGKHSSAKGKGTGMGLAIVRAILAAHGGGIEAVNAPGGGTKFCFWVPLEEKPGNASN
jgi:two-component system, OmpR family, sensor histidine kinase KdpD